MSTVQIVAQVSPDKLLEAIRQMDLAELDRLVPRVQMYRRGSTNSLLGGRLRR
jgi:hypothetical protein